MRKLWSVLLTLAVVFCMSTPLTAYATGEGNIDGGGGNMGDATSHGSWNPGNEGVRVTIVRSSDHAVVSTPFDLTNKAPSSSIYHFGKVSKIQYNNGMMGYAIIKCFFSNLKRGGILLIQIAVGSLYMFSVPRGYMDGFIQWCKQIIGLCLTTFLQATILTAGLLVLKDHALLGLGLMLSAGEVPRICGAFGLETSTHANIMSAVYAAQAAVNTTRTVVQAVGAAK